MKYFFGFLAAIALIIVVFVLLFRGLTGNRQPNNQIPLLNYSNTNAMVSVAVDGPINADQEHNSYQISVGRSEARMEVSKGYNRQVIASKIYTNNDESFANFLRALDLAGFTKGVTKPTAEANDPRGVCATGQRYSFKITSGGADVQNFWATSCGGQGTFKGSISQVQQLFRAQIPEYSKILSGVRL